MRKEQVQPIKWFEVCCWIVGRMVSNFKKKGL